MAGDFKFVLWINYKAELIREEKQKKRRRVRRLGLLTKCTLFMPDAA
jgi:hypothetical protein